MANYHTKCDREELIELIRPMAGILTAKQIGEKLGYSERYILNTANLFNLSLKKPPSISLHDYQLIKQLIADGMKKPLICEKFEVSSFSLNRWLKIYESQAV